MRKKRESLDPCLVSLRGYDFQMETQSFFVLIPDAPHIVEQRLL